MNVIIKKSQVKGKIFAPPSKSYAHRLLISSFLSNGNCEVKNVAFSKDILETLNCLKTLGANFIIKESSVEFFKSEISPLNEFEVLESGSTLRFFIPIALALLDKSSFKCGKRLFDRGISVYNEIFKNQISLDNENLKILLNGRLKEDRYKIKGDVSSQFITGLMFSLPLLKKDSYIEIIPPFESVNYVDITIDVLKTFGVEILKIKENEFFIKGNQKYGPTNTIVEGDYSNSAFFDAFNYIGGEVEVLNLNKDSKQGDKAYKEIFEKLKKGYFDIDLTDCIDLAPIVFVVASLNAGGNFNGTKRLSIKESDRGLSMKEELNKVGGKVSVFENNIKVERANLKNSTCVISSHNDHRIVMSMSVLLTQIGGKIQGVECVNKSFPNFFKELEKLNIGIIYED